MAIITVAVRVDGLSEVIRKLKESETRMKDLTKPLRKGSLLMLRSINLNFKRGGRPKLWKSLSRSTRLSKIKQGYSLLPLTKTGALRRSITTKVFRNRFTVGTSIPYSAIHQLGGKAGRNKSVKIPARPYLIFQKIDIENINQLVSDYIIGEGSGNGL